MKDQKTDETGWKYKSMLCGKVWKWRGSFIQDEMTMYLKLWTFSSTVSYFAYLYSARRMFVCYMPMLQSKVIRNIWQGSCIYIYTLHSIHEPNFLLHNSNLSPHFSLFFCVFFQSASRFQSLDSLRSQEFPPMNLPKSEKSTKKKRRNVTI